VRGTWAKPLLELVALLALLPPHELYRYVPDVSARHSSTGSTDVLPEPEQSELV